MSNVTTIITTSQSTTGSLTNGSDFWPIVISLIVASGLLAIVTIIVQKVSDSRKEDNNRKRLAQLLGLEIKTILMICKLAITQHKKDLEKIKKDLASRNPPTVPMIIDVNLPRAVYDRPWVDVRLFPPKLSSTIVAIYHWVLHSKEIKERANSRASALERLLNNPRVDDPMGFITASLSLLEQFAQAEEAYISHLELIAKLCESAIVQIEGIAKIESPELNPDLTIAAGIETLGENKVNNPINNERGSRMRTYLDVGEYTIFVGALITMVVYGILAYFQSDTNLKLADAGIFLALAGIIIALFSNAGGRKDNQQIIEKLNRILVRLP